MKTNEVWKITTLKIIETESHKIHKKDYTFYHIDRMKRIVEHISNNGDVCSECAALQSDAEFLATNFVELLNSSVSQKREYEKRFDKLMLHLKKHHDVVPYNYLPAYYSFVYMIIGAAIGALVGLVAFFPKILVATLVGWVIGLIVGQFLGNRKELQYRVGGRII